MEDNQDSVVNSIREEMVSPYNTKNKEHDPVIERLVNCIKSQAKIHTFNKDEDVFTLMNKLSKKSDLFEKSFSNGQYDLAQLHISDIAIIGSLIIDKLVHLAKEKINEK